MMAALGSLTPEQNIFVDRTSAIVVGESTTSLDTNSSDNELESKLHLDSFNFAASRMLSSGSQSDKRFIKLL